MKTNKIVLTSFLIIVICSAFKIADTTLQKINASEAEIKKAVVEAAVYGKTTSFNSFAVGLTNFGIIKQIVKGKLLVDKQEVINSAMSFVKSYYNSAEFKADYKAKMATVVNPVSVDDSFKLKKQYEDNLKALETAFNSGKKYTTKAENEETLTKYTGASNQGIDKALEMLKNNPQIAAQSGMSAEQIQQMLSQAKAGVASGKEKGQEKIDEVYDNGGEQKIQDDYQKKYEDEKRNLKINYERDLADLRKYLNASDSKGNTKGALSNLISLIDEVDFNAELTTGNSNSKKTFVKKEYEAKSGNWKFVFRAGKENAMLVRAAAAQWLSELK